MLLSSLRQNGYGAGFVCFVVGGWEGGSMSGSAGEWTGEVVREWENKWVGA